MDVTVRAATRDDAGFLAEMLVVAWLWRPDAPVRTVRDALAKPDLAHYVEGWPRPGDLGVVAQTHEGTRLGAAWLRLFPAADPAYGYVDDATPELSIGVRADARGAGVGRALMVGLLDAARVAGVPAVSLSVEADNPARRLYEQLGFLRVAGTDDAPVMLLRLAPP